jgi:hypothetical protein
MSTDVTLVSDAASAQQDMRKQQAALFERDALPYLDKMGVFHPDPTGLV